MFSPAGLRTVMANVPDNAHDGTRALQANEFVDRILSRKIVLRRSFVEDRHGFTALSIGAGKETPPEQRYSDCAEVVRRNLREIDVQWRHLPAGHVEVLRDQVSTGHQFHGDFAGLLPRNQSTAAQ